MSMERVWKLTAYGKRRLPLVGVPWRDLTAAEYAAAESRHPGMGERYFTRPQPSTHAEPFDGAQDERARDAPVAGAQDAPQALREPFDGAQDAPQDERKKGRPRR